MTDRELKKMVKWNISDAKKLLDCFLEVEEDAFPEYHKEKAKERSKTVRKFILDYGVNHVTIKNYTNMMLEHSSLTIDVFDTERWMEGDITIYLGSETHELSANRTSKLFRFDSDLKRSVMKVTEQKFNFKLWKWEDVKK